VSYAENRRVVDGLRPDTEDDWLIVAGDVGEILDDVVETLALLRARFRAVIWTPGNHELWTHPSDPVRLRGEQRYRELVRRCRDADIRTPEDEYLVWHGAGGPVTVAPQFLLYDNSFRAPGTTSKAESLTKTYEAGIVCTDERCCTPTPTPTGNPGARPG
jgi:3',5'-cyclic AMP phosphodiesterase CpdA